MNPGWVGVFLEMCLCVKWAIGVFESCRVTLRLPEEAQYESYNVPFVCGQVRHENICHGHG